MRHLRPFGLLLAAATLASCGILYTDIKVPRGYRTATPAEVKSAPASIRRQAWLTMVIFIA